MFLSSIYYIRALILSTTNGDHANGSMHYLPIDAFLAAKDGTKIMITIIKRSPSPHLNSLPNSQAKHLL